MNWIEILLVTLGISLDIFAAVECQGALVVKISKKQLIIVSVLLSLWQMIALFLGNLCAIVIHVYELRDRSEHFVAALIFFGMGIRLCIKVWKNESILERRIDKPEVKEYVKMSAVASIYSFLTGVACGFLGCSLPLMLGMVVAFTAAMVILGMYIGYHYGYQTKGKAYLAGALLLIIAGADMMIRCFQEAHLA